MREVRGQFAFAFIVLMVAGLAHAAPAPPPLPDLSTFPDSLGVNIHFTDPKPGELDQIYAAGFRWVRMDFAWAGIERKKGEYDFSAYDRLIAALDQHHMRAYLILDYSCPFYDNGLSPYTDEGRAAFAKWAAASVHHFKGHGIIWEMWNEPNGGFWKPKANVDDYAKLALAVGKGIREGEPGEIYIGPATSSIDMPFLESCFKAGCLEYWSAVSVHPYRQKDPETVADEYRALRRLIAKYAPAGRQIPIISGEWGYSSAWENFDEARQGKYLPREFLTNIANGIPLSIWYDWHEDGKDPKEAEHHFGIVRPDAIKDAAGLYEPKPAYRAARELADALNGFSFDKELEFRPDCHILMFRNKKGAIALAHWTTGTRAQVQGPPLSFWSTFLVTPAVKVEFPKASGELDLAAAWSAVPAEVVFKAPGTLRIETTIRNPFKTSTLAARAQNGKEIVLDVDQEGTIVSEFPIDRGSESVPISVRVRFETAGPHSMKTWLAQRTVVVVANPLIAELLPTVANVQLVRLQNPSGEALKGHVMIVGEDNAQMGSTDVVIAAGTTEELLQIPLAPDRSKDGNVTLTIKDTDRNPILELPPTRLAAGAGISGDDLEKSWRLVPDGDAKIASEQTLTRADAPAASLAAGLDAFRLDYRFDKGWKFIRLAPTRDAVAAISGTPSGLGLLVYGDGQGNVARMRFTDSTGQNFQPGGDRITWKGWRYVEFPLGGRDSTHWGGANDGMVHFPIPSGIPGDNYHILALALFSTFWLTLRRERVAAPRCLIAAAKARAQAPAADSG